MNPPRLAALVLLPALLLGIAGCRKARSVREDLAIKTLDQASPHPAEFRTLYPSAIGFFTHFDDDYAPTTWHARAGIGGRYLLQMRIEVQLSPDRSKVVSAKAPRFVLMEVASLQKTPEGPLRVKYNSASQKDFGVNDWILLVNKKGDLTALGVQPGEPVPDFDKSWPDF